MRREKKEEIRRYVRNIRYIKILGDCDFTINYNTIPLKKGDVIRLYNDQIEDLVFNKKAGILFSMGYSEYGKTSGAFCKDPFPEFILKEYPADKALDIIEYIKMQGKVKVKEPMYTSVWISNEWVYLSEEFLNKMMNYENEIPLLDGRSMSVSEYNRKNILSAFRNGTEIIKYEVGNKLLPLFENYSNGEDSAHDKEIHTLVVPQSLKDVKPGIYKIKEKKSYIPLDLVLKPGDEIDFSKPEFGLLAINQDFMKVLARSREITNLKEKERIYKSELKGFFKDSNVKYYRIKKCINLNEQDVPYLATSADRPNKSINVGYGYDRYRVRGNISAIETINGRVAIIKVEYTNSAIMGIMDKEIRKIARKMNQRESLHAYMLERDKKQKLKEEKNKKIAQKNQIDYYRTKMMVDLAKSYIMDKKYIDWYKKEKKLEDDASEYSEERIEERFVEDAFNYKLKNKKRYYKIMEVIDSGITTKDFYMMHLIRERFKDNRNIDNEYQRQYKEKQRRLLQILSEKGEDKTR